MRFSGEVRRSLGEVRTLGSIAQELALTAYGTLQYSIFSRPKIWDVAAGVLLAKSAGGLALLRQGRGEPWVPLERFQPRAGSQSELDGYREWSGAVVVGNPEIAWTIATSMRRPLTLPRPVGSLLRKAHQLLPLAARAPLLRERPAATTQTLHSGRVNEVPTRQFHNR